MATAVLPDRKQRSGDSNFEITHICPSKSWAVLQLRELWAYRELLYFLTWRDVKVRYKQTVLGAAWAILQPLATVLIFSIFFGRLAKMPSDGLPYTVFCFAGLVPWMFFAFGLNQSSQSLVANANLITKVYFPRLAIPIATVFAGVIDFVIAFVLLVGMMQLYHVPIARTFPLVLVFALLGLITSLGVGIWLSALNVQFRDVRYFIPYLVQFWMYATPIIYPSSLLREPWKTLYGLNPMVGVVEGFRWALIGTKPPGPMILASSAAAVIVLVTGMLYFRKMEKTFADVI